MSDIKTRLQNDMKAAMKAKEKARLTTIRSALAAIKQKEVDGQTTLDDDQIIAVVDKMVKQRKESLSQYQEAGRDDLADVETAEIAVLQEYLPAALSDAEISSMIDAAIAESGAESMRDMGKVMGLLKPKMQGRADMSAVSATIKAKLNG